MTTIQSRIRQTGFKVGETDVRFGMLWPDGQLGMTDFGRRTKDAELEGIGGLTVIQLFGVGPYQITYRAFFETLDEFKAHNALVQQTGTLTVVSRGHSVPVDGPNTVWIHERAYDRLDGVLLRSVGSAGVAPDGTVEADLTFVVPS
jgi:hypothetical protein